MYDILFKTKTELVKQTTKLYFKMVIFLVHYNFIERFPAFSQVLGYANTVINYYSK